MSTSSLGKRVQRYMATRKTRKVGRIQYTRPYTRIPNVYRGIRPEMKTWTNAMTNLHPLTPLGIYQPLNMPLPGTGRDQRIGSKIQIKGLSLKGSIEADFTSNRSDPCLWRIVVVYDKASHGNQPDEHDLFDCPGVLRADMPFMHHNLGSRFRVIWDHYIWKGPTYVYGSGVTDAKSEGATRAYYTFDKTWKLNLPTHFYDTGVGSVADIEQGGLFLYLFCSQGVVVSNFDGFSQIRYIDV